MSEKMRTTVHNGRRDRHDHHVFSAWHNDRKFKGEPAHIDKEKSIDNLYWSWNGAADFDTAEQDFYLANYGKQLDDTNAIYIKSGHAKKTKKMSEWRKDPIHAPDNQLLYIGRVTNTVSVDTLKSCLDDFLQSMNDWNASHGNHVHYLDWALHQDEQGAPHVHLRRVFDYTDDKGQVKLGQNKALEAAGVALPHPDKKVDKRNNRKMTFTKMEQTVWQDIAKAHGFDIETTPRPKQESGKPIAQFIAQQEQKRVDMLEQVELRNALLDDRAIELGQREALFNTSLKAGRGLRAQPMTRQKKLETIGKLASDKDLDEVVEYIGAVYNRRQNLAKTAKRAKNAPGRDSAQYFTTER